MVVACSVCGTETPGHEALFYGKAWLCSEDCRQEQIRESKQRYCQCGTVLSPKKLLCWQCAEKRKYRPVVKKKCQNCETTVQGRHGNQFYCSKNCQIQYNEKRRQEKNRLRTAGLEGYGTIYALLAPGGAIRYIGQTTTPLQERLYHHFRDRNRTHTHKNHWLQTLSAPPSILSLGVYPRSVLDQAEIDWIAALRRAGHDLTNANQGGAGMRHAVPKPSRVRLCARCGDPCPSRNRKYCDDCGRRALGPPIPKCPQLLVEYDGREHTWREWEQETGITSDNIKSRLKQGWSREEAFTRPVSYTPRVPGIRNARFIEFNGRTQTLSEWALEVDVSVSTLHHRLSKWPLEKALTLPPDLKRSEQAKASR